jgi:hypothetical protein
MKRPRTPIPDPYIDQATAPVDTGEMEAAAKLSTHIADPDDKPHVIRRAAGSTDGKQLPHAELRIAGGAGALRLPARQVTRTGVSLEIPPDTALEVAEGVSVVVDLHLGEDANGQAIRARLPALVAHLRKPSARAPGGISLRWDTRGRGVIEQLALLLDRLGATGG